MKHLLITFIIMFSIQSSKDCALNGEYRMIMDKEFNQSLDFVINFQDSIYNKTSAFGINKGKISTIIGRNNKCIFYLVDDNYVIPEMKSKIDTMLNTMGKHIIEIEGPIKDTIKFRTTYSDQLHITINSGILVKN